MKSGEEWVNTVRISTELENIRKNQTKLKNTTTEIKNTLGINNRLDDTEKWISKLEDRAVKINHAEQKKEFYK